MSLGIDLVKISRIEAIRSSHPRTLTKILNEIELSGDSQFIAGRIAAKEAVIKAIPNLTMKNLKDISIVNSEDGKPKIVLVGNELKNWEVEISISHDGDYAIAVALSKLVEHSSEKNEYCEK